MGFCLAATASLHAQDFVYWANTGGDSIGRANLDGTSPSQTFITGAGTPYGLALDDTYIYWANLGGGTIGRANLDGTGADVNFMTGLDTPAAVEVNATHIFWTSQNGNTIGRANLDGSSPNASFITGANIPFGVRVNATHIFWSNGGTTTLGRANLDGTLPTQTFITGATNPAGIDLNATHIHWANSGGTTIGRANIDGTSVSQTFITGGDRPGHVAVNATHAYFTSQNDFTIGQANLDGTSANHSFITGANFPIGVEVAAGETELPVELSAFDARASRRTIHLRWQTESETNNAGFEVQTSADAGVEEDWSVLGFVEGRGTTDERHEYGYTVLEAEPGVHLYRLKQIDYDGSFRFSAVVEVSVELPGTHVLSEAFPNPFETKTELALVVGRDQEVTIDLFDLTGRLVRSVSSRLVASGVRHVFDIHRGGLPDGLYMVRVVGENFDTSRVIVATR